MLLDKYTKSSVRHQTTSEGISFDQKGGARNKPLPPYDKNIAKICNDSNAYRKDTQNNIAQKLLAMQTVVKQL